ncbi:MAG TPA: EAL domain-containing protein [Anaerolineales bacterium]|nr:EAL domain-containing protein [Anaerolineales bacterium]
MNGQPQPLNTALQAILWKRLMLPYLAAVFFVVGLAAYYGGRLVESQQLRYSRSIEYTVTNFLLQAGQNLDSFTTIVSTGNLELIDISINAEQDSHEIFDTIYVLDADKTIITLAPFDERYVGLDMSRRNYFKGLDCDSGVNFSIPFTSLRTGEPTAYLLRCTESGEYIVGELNLGALQDSINESVSSENGIVFIVDQTGTLLAHPDPQFVAQHVNVGNWLVVEKGFEEESTTRYWRDGNVWLGSASIISPTDWIVVAEVPLVNVYAPYMGTLIALALALVVIFSLSVRVFLSQLQQKLVAPLIHLTDSADALADGNYVHSKSIMDDDVSYVEMNKLLANFKKMGLAITARESQLQESQEQYRLLLDYSPSAILLHRESIIMYANDAAITLYAARDSSDFIGRSILELVHPDSHPLVRSRLQKMEEEEQVLPLVEQRHIRFDQSPFLAEVTTSSVYFGGTFVAQTIVQDITRRKEEEKALRYRATHDPLTDLPNRFLFQDRLQHVLAKSRRNKTFGAVLYLDLDGFKSINDAFGHSVGDQVLQYVGKALRSSLREEDTVARLGGDEFVALLDELKDPAEAEQVADHILRSFSKPYQVADEEINISFSIGVAIFPTDGDESHVLLQSSDAAMYQAKREGKRRIKYYASHMRERSLEKLNLQSQLSHALDQDQLFLQYQPQVNGETGEIIGVEALVRWRHPELGLIPPEEFISVAEETGLILPIGEWILHTACEQAKKWHDLHKLRVAVNLSNLQLRQPTMVKTVKDVLEQFDISPDLLEIELTENIVFQNADTSFDELYQLKSLGVLLAMDDFGTGFSTLGYLAHIPFDRIKIDQKLISNIDNPKDAAVVSGIIAICRNLNLEVIAEGVETDEQLAFCSSKGCNFFQGWYYSPAVDASEITRYLVEGVPWEDKIK